MVELVPFLLFLMEWHPDRPRDVQLTRVEQVFVSTEDCEAAGATIVADLIEQRADPELVIDFSCQAVPPTSEFEEMAERNFGGSGK